MWRSTIIKIFAGLTLTLMLASVHGWCMDQVPTAGDIGPVATSPRDDRDWPLYGYVFDVGTICSDQNILGCEFAGYRYILTGSNNANNPNYVYFMSWSGALFDSVPQPTTSTYGWRDLAWDGDYLYAGDEADTIRAFDVRGNLDPSWNIPKPSGITVVRGLAYDPATDHFWTADGNSPLVEFDRSGNTIWSGPLPSDWSNVYGLAWDPLGMRVPTLWGFCQVGSPATTIKGFNTITHQSNGQSNQVPMLPGCYSQSAGGITYNWDCLGFPLFIGIAQASPSDRLFHTSPIYPAPPPADITLSGSSLLQTVPATGGNVNYTVTFYGNELYPIPVQVWGSVYTPNDTIIGPIVGPISLTIQPGLTTRNRTLSVPASTPPGYYAFIASVGVYPNEDWSSGHFEFIKSETEAGELVSDWSDFGEPFEDFQEIAPPARIVHQDAFPNPFNATTVLSFELRAASFVSLGVYDISGKLVEALVDGWRAAGRHEVTFNGSALASGIYIYRLEAGEFTASGKMVLMK